MSSERELVERATGRDFTSEYNTHLESNGSDAGFSSAIWHRYRARRNAGIGLTALGGALDGAALILGLYVVITEGMGQPADTCGPDGTSLCDVDQSPPTGIRVAGWTLIGVGTATLVSGVVLLANGSKVSRGIARAHGRGWKPEPRKLSFGGVIPALDPSTQTAALGVQFSF